MPEQSHRATGMAAVSTGHIHVGLFPGREAASISTFESDHTFLIFIMQQETSTCPNLWDFLYMTLMNELMSSFHSPPSALYHRHCILRIILSWRNWSCLKGSETCWGRGWSLCCMTHDISSTAVSVCPVQYIYAVRGPVGRARISSG